MKTRLLTLLLVAALLIPLAGVAPVMANPGTLEVSLPVQVTNDSHYERGQSVVYDGTNYWLFYGRSASVTGNYGSTNPDTHDYSAYYKKAGTIPGLVSATAASISGVAHNANSYLGETGAAYYGGEVWAFATIDVGATAELYGWYTTDGSSWNEVGPIVTGLSDGQAHHDEVAFNGELWVVEGSGNFTTMHSATPKAGGWSTPLNVDASLTGGLVHFFADGSDLYLAINASGMNYIYKYNSGTTAWDKVDDDAPPNKYDPTLFKAGSDYVFAQAPWDGTKQYILAWSGATLDSTFFDGSYKLVTEGAYGSNPWVDMWPIGFTDAGGTGYLFYTSERDQPSAEGTGNIWYLEVNWDLSRDHYTYIQEAVDAAADGDTINVAAGTYDETIDVDARASLDIVGAGAATAIIKPSSTLSWAIPGYPQYDSRLAAVRVVASTDIDFSDFTFDFDLVKGNSVHGLLYWDSTGTLDGNTLKNMSLPDSTAYYEITSYVRAPSYSDASRAQVTFTGNTFVDTGRLGIVTHQYVYAAISGNVFYKNVDDFGYAMEIGSESTASISGNTIYGYDTPAASDGSQSAGIYIENSFTGGSPGMTKNVALTSNEVYDCQWALYIGNEFDGYAGDIDIVATVSNNDFHDNVEGGAVITDEDKEYGSSVTVDCGGNSLTDNGDYGYYIYSQGDGDITVDLSGEIITGHADSGIHVEDTALPSSSSYSVSITDSNLGGNTSYGLNNTVGSLVDASANWWGTNTPAGVAAQINGNVDYTPWLGSGTDTSSDPGFQGDYSTLWVDDDSPQTGTTGRIQEGINLVTASTVNVVAGTYNETLTFDDTSVDGLIVQGADPGDRPQITGGVLFDNDTDPLDGATLKNLLLTGDADPTTREAIISMKNGAAVNDFAMDNCVLDGQNVVLSDGLDGRNGMVGSKLGQSFSVTNTEFKNILGWALLDMDASYAGPPVGGNELVLSTVTFSGNNIHDCNGSVALRGNATTRTPQVDAIGNTWSNIGGVGGYTGYQWAALEVNNTVQANVQNNTIDGVQTGGYGEGQAIQFWNVETLDVSGNTITDNAEGIKFYSDGAGGTYCGSYGCPVPGGTVTANKLEGNVAYGIAVAAAASGGPLNAEGNWWGDASGPSHETNPSGTGDTVSDDVDYSAWLGNWPSSPGANTYYVNTTSDTADINDLIANTMSSGDTLVFTAGTYPGGINLGKAGISIRGEGATIGSGSPAFTVTADDEVIEDLVLDGGGTTADPAILVNAAVDNLIVQDNEIKAWADGIEVAYDVTNLKVVGNWIHDNAYTGLQINSLVSVSGETGSITGNLFKDNGGNGVQNDGATADLDVQFNSWGDIDGAAEVDGGDGVGGSVDASNPTFAEVFVDVDPDTLAISRHLNELSTFDVAVKVDAAGLYAVQYKLSYDTDYLTLDSVADGPFDGTGTCTTDTSVVGEVAVFCTRFEPDADAGGTGLTVTTASFVADGSGRTGNGPWTTHLNLSVDGADLSAGARGGVKVYVNNGGFGADSGLTGHTISDDEDGEIIIDGLANYTGYVDLQGRTNDSGASLKVYSQEATSGAVLYASGSSASSGKYTTVYESTFQLVIGETYWLQVDRALYLPTTVKHPSLATYYAHGKELTTRPLTTLGTLLLLGGDADNSDLIDLFDATCIGGAYGGAPTVCGTDGSSDVNGDGVVNILDLVLMGGNYDLNQSTWMP